MLATRLLGMYCRLPDGPLQYSKERSYRIAFLSTPLSTSQISAVSEPARTDYSDAPEPKSPVLLWSGPFAVFLNQKFNFTEEAKSQLYTPHEKSEIGGLLGK
jgi:hypothetical protein